MKIIWLGFFLARSRSLCLGQARTFGPNAPLIHFKRPRPRSRAEPRPTFGLVQERTHFIGRRALQTQRCSQVKNVSICSKTKKLRLILIFQSQFFSFGRRKSIHGRPQLQQYSRYSKKVEKIFQKTAPKRPRQKAKKVWRRRRNWPISVSGSDSRQRGLPWTALRSARGRNSTSGWKSRTLGWTARQKLGISPQKTVNIPYSFQLGFCWYFLLLLGLLQIWQRRVPQALVTRYAKPTKAKNLRPCLYFRPAINRKRK